MATHRFGGVRSSVTPQRCRPACHGSCWAGLPRVGRMLCLFVDLLNRSTKVHTSAFSTRSYCDYSSRTLPRYNCNAIIAIINCHSERRDAADRCSRRSTATILPMAVSVISRLSTASSSLCTLCERCVLQCAALAPPLSCAARAGAAHIARTIRLLKARGAQQQLLVRHSRWSSTASVAASAAAES
jgi:hypothetical protein